MTERQLFFYEAPLSLACLKSGEYIDEDVYWLTWNTLLDQMSLLYSIDTLNRDWLPAADAEDTFIVNGVSTPPETISMDDLLDKIKEVNQLVEISGGTEEARHCVQLSYMASLKGEDAEARLDRCLN